MAEKLIGELEMLEDEEIVTQLGELQLTSKRLAYTGRARRGSLTTAAMIEDIDSATIQTRRPSLALIIIGVILALTGIPIMSQYYTREYSWILPVIGIIMAALFFLLETRVVQFTIAGTDWLTVSMPKLGGRAEVADFINKFFELKDRLSKG